MTIILSSSLLGLCLPVCRSVSFPRGSVSHWVSFCFLSFRVCVSLGVVLSSSLPGLCLTGARSVFFPSGSVSRWGSFCILPFRICVSLRSRSVFFPPGSVSHCGRSGFFPSMTHCGVVLSSFLQGLCLAGCRSTCFPSVSVSRWASFCLLSFRVCVSLGVVPSSSRQGLCLTESRSG